MEKNVTKKWNAVIGRDNEWYCVLPSQKTIYVFLNAKTKTWCLTCESLRIIHYELNVETLEDAKAAAEKYIARYMRQKIDTMQYDIDSLVGPKKTFLVGFNSGDETEFDVDSYAELMECLVGFFAENGIAKPRINYIEEYEYKEETDA